MRSDSNKKKKRISAAATGFGYDHTFKRTTESNVVQKAAAQAGKPARTEKTVSKTEEQFNRKASHVAPVSKAKKAVASAERQNKKKASLLSNQKKEAKEERRAVNRREHRPFADTVAAASTKAAGCESIPNASAAKESKRSLRQRKSSAAAAQGRKAAQNAASTEVTAERAPFSYQITALSTERQGRVLAKERGARGQIQKLMQHKEKFFPQAVALVLVVLTALLAFPAMNTAMAEAPVAEGGYSAAADEGAVNVAVAYNKQQELSTVSVAAGSNTVAIKINGTTAAYCYSKEDAQWVLDQIQSAYKGLTYQGKATAPAFLETVTIVAEQGDAMGKEEALLKLANNADHAVYYVKEGDTAASIAKAYGMTVDELNSMNKNGIKANSYIRVKGTGPMANVVTKETRTKDTPIAHKTTTKNDSSLAKGRTKVKTKGVDGISRTTTTVIYINGKAVGQTESTATVKEPVTEVVLKGTKKTSSGGGSASGGGGVAGAPSFAWPLRAGITSPFGYRWGRLHAGIDMGVAVGTPVKASYGGTVTRAGDAGDYGKLVEINHGNGYVTRYAHNSKINVKVGQKVSKGQVVAYSGNTGRSTGPHLHFEIRVKGVAKNPIPYLP